MPRILSLEKVIRPYLEEWLQHPLELESIQVAPARAKAIARVVMCIGDLWMKSVRILRDFKSGKRQRRVEKGR
jgi:hypothetical protein